jgi:hypothetical protein
MLPNAGFPDFILNSILLKMEGFLKASFYVEAKCKESSRPPTKPFPKSKNLTLSATKVGRFLLLAHWEPSKQWVCHHPVNTPSIMDGVYVGTLIGAASCLAL